MFTYYRYLDKFHQEPKEWKDLFEYLDYNSTDAEINKAIIADKERNNG